MRRRWSPWRSSTRFATKCRDLSARRQCADSADRSAHISHDAAHRWFETVGRASWATCPITENGVIRIVGHPRYPNRSGSTADVAVILRTMRELSGHVFWPDSLSLTEAAHVDLSQILTSAQVTDTYLLALARANGGKLATFDRRLSVKAVRDGKAALHLIGSS